MPDPTPIKFPAANPSAPGSLSLRRRAALTRAPFAVSEATAAARESIKALVSATRAPFGGGGAAEGGKLGDLERALRQLELKLAERENLIEENEVRLADQERNLAELEALLLAREKLIAASQRRALVQAPVSPEEKAALDVLRAELERQEGSVA